MRCSFMDIMMFSPDVRSSVIAACKAGSSTSTTPPHCAPWRSKPKPRSPISSDNCCSRRAFSPSSSANSTSSSAAGSPFRKASKVGRKIGISLASSIMVASTSSMAMGFSFTRCWAASMAAWNEPKWHTPKPRRPSNGQSLSSMAVE